MEAAWLIPSSESGGFLRIRVDRSDSEDVFDRFHSICPDGSVSMGAGLGDVSGTTYRPELWVLASLI